MSGIVCGLVGKRLRYEDLIAGNGLAAVIALMRASSNWTQFQRGLQRAFPKHGDQGTLDIGGD